VSRALIALSIAAREPDEERPYGYQKAEYFSTFRLGMYVMLAVPGGLPAPAAPNSRVEA
jgi:divalent metal cation (Fe/Co/Zn/Cd) transporter